MTAAPVLTFIPDLVETHFDEVWFLWTQRRSALRSPSYVARQLAALEERIEGHIEGVLVLGDRLLEFVEPAFTGEDAMPSFAAALVSLRLGTPAAIARTLSALADADEKKLPALRDALAYGPSAPLHSHLRALVSTAPVALGAAAAEVLAFHGAIAPAPQHLQRFIHSEVPAARASGWRVAAYCAVSVPAEWYDAALRDDDAEVKRAALTAAAWSGYPGLYPYCRALAVAPTPESIEALALLAAVSPPDEYQTIGAVAAEKAAGPGRYHVVATFGHPHYIEWLIAEMSSSDPASAAAAGRAFTKMTGRDVESNQRVKVSADTKPPADDFEAEFADDVFLPDPAVARMHWHELAPRLAHAPRICRGIDVSRPLSREQLATLDRESLWEYCLRARLRGGWQGTPLVLERYPQRF